MPLGEPDPSDPTVLLGVGLPVSRAAVVEMACTFAEELAQMGRSEAQILALFKNPHYRGPHAAWRVLGREEIEGIVGESCAVYGRVRGRVSAGGDHRGWENEAGGQRDG